MGTGPGSRVLQTASATFDFHAPDRRWEVKATPFYTHVEDYIDAVQWTAASNTPTATPLIRRAVWPGWDRRCRSAILTA